MTLIIIQLTPFPTRFILTPFDEVRENIKKKNTENKERMKKYQVYEFVDDSILDFIAVCFRKALNTVTIF